MYFGAHDHGLWGILERMPIANMYFTSTAQFLLGFTWLRFCTNDEKTVECEKQELFIGFIPFQTVYVLLLQFSKCRELRVFWCIISSKTAVA